MSDVLIFESGLCQLAALKVGDEEWRAPAIAIGIVGVFLAVWFSRRRFAALGLATLLRVTGWLLIAACLVNPLWSSARPRRGANVFAVVADVSRSHQVASSESETRSEQLAELLEQGERTESGGWLNYIDQDFELRRYVVSDQLKRVDRYNQPPFDGTASNLNTALEQLKQRYSGQPLAGIILLSDGNATDALSDQQSLQGLAPVYPVVLNEEVSQPDVSVGTVSVTQSAFDDAPVTIQVQASHSGLSPAQQIQVTLLDAEGTPLESQTHEASEELPFRFHARPETAGTVFYNVDVAVVDAEGNAVSEEATLINNHRLLAVDRGSHKRRVLYVSGRPNWEFKFFRRATETDPQTDLVGLIRIARKEAKFDFRGREGEQSNPLFRGFEESEQETAEEYDEPVLVRIGTKDDDELLDGFPETAEELFAYDAIIVDDMEADFFLADQLQLIYEFVSRRGGGLLMTGGQESFRRGEYDRTPVGEMLPVDLHRSVEGPGGPVRLDLTTDGWLQPWVRLRDDEEAEHQRLQQMPGFQALNPVELVRPGAVVMAKVSDEQGRTWPALVVQRFGRGRTAALCIADLWRWRLHDGLRELREQEAAFIPGATDVVAPGGKPNEDLNDYARASRQMIRWLVADVPRRLNVTARPEPSLGLGAWRITADIRGKDFVPREDAEVRVRITKPDGEVLELAGDPSEDQIGRFDVIVSALEPGAYVAEVVAILTQQDEDPEELIATTGWASQPDQEEMASIRVNNRYLQQVAAETGGHIVAADDIDDFVESLSGSDAPIVELWSWPVWHQWWVFIAAVCCFVGDWTIRRRNGMP
jgi:hypothetical protein